MEELSSKVAVVTGAASGIGRALADELAAAGMRLVLADIEPEPLEETVAALAGRGTEVIGIPTDVASWDAVAALRDGAFDRFDTVHLVVNNAGVGSGGQLWDLEISDWEWVLGVDLWGVIHGVKAFVPTLVAQGIGHVVNTASMAGLTSPPFMGPYNVAKHGVVTLTETLAAELGMVAPGVGTTVVCPGWVKTRIDDSARNRPGGDAVDPADIEATAGIRDAIGGLIAGGIAPQEVARAVVEAVRTNRFYVLTHPDMVGGIIDRTRRMADGLPPASAMDLFS